MLFRIIRNIGIARHGIMVGQGDRSVPFRLCEEHQLLGRIFPVRMRAM